MTPSKSAAFRAEQAFGVRPRVARPGFRLAGRGRPDVGTAKAVRSAVLMADQPNNRPSCRAAQEDVELLSDLLGGSETCFVARRYVTPGGPDDVDDALQSAYARFLERFRRRLRNPRLALHDCEARSLGDAPPTIASAGD